jgi:recombination protein RecA
MAKKVEKKSAKGPVSARAKELEDIVAQIRKVQGAESILCGSISDIKPMQVISTGSLSLNKALGVGGYPKGRIIEIYGQESSGKTTLTLHAIAEAQKQGIICAFIDAEHALDTKYAQTIGVNVGELLISQPDSGEQGLEIADMLLKTGKVGVIVIDSVAALTPQKELDGEMGDSHMGLQARMMSQALRKITGTIHKTNCTMFFINQIRSKIGVMFGSPETTTGGNALKFYASIRLKVSAGEKVKQKDANGDEQIIGGIMVVKVLKNKVAPPFTEAECPVKYGFGLDLGGEVYLRAVESGIFQVNGGTHYFEDEKIAGSKNDCKEKLNSKSATFDKKLFDTVYDKVMTSYEVPVGDPVDEGEETEPEE